MAASIRTNSKARKIYHKIMGHPFKSLPKTEKQKRIDKALDQKLIYTNPIYTSGS